MTNIKTVIHTYSFDLRENDQAETYRALKAKLGAQVPHPMISWGNGSHYMPEIDGKTVELETAHLFDNQWNTAPIDGISDKGLRVFDWAEDATGDGLLPAHNRRGHWLEQTPAMAEIRHNNVKCGYCGHMQRIEAAPTFCDRCIDSEYLTESDLYLLRLQRIDESDIRNNRPPLTDNERALLVPKYRDAQLHGSTERGRARIVKARQDLESKFQKAISAATTEHDGMLWLMDHGINTDNVIFYSHTGRFSFGWRKPCDNAFVSELLEIISEFRFPYEIKCTDGRNLQGN